MQMNKSVNFLEIILLVYELYIFSNIIQFADSIKSIIWFYKIVSSWQHTSSRPVYRYV